MRTRLILLAILLCGLTGTTPSPVHASASPIAIRASSHARFGTLRPTLDAPAGSGNTGGQFSKSEIERFRCTSSGNRATAVDMSCNTSNSDPIGKRSR